MPITNTDLIDALKIYAPHGVTLPKDPDTNAIHTATIDRWISRAVSEIQIRRQILTREETMITMVAGQQDYDLPDDARDVVEIQRNLGTTIDDLLGVPEAGVNVGGIPSGTLPSGQEISGAIDFIVNQRRTRVDMENDWTMFEGKIRFLFPINEGGSVKVIYRRFNDSIDDLPIDLFETILLYLRYSTLDWYIAKYATVQQVDGADAKQVSIVPLQTERDRLKREWRSRLEAIPATAA